MFLRLNLKRSCWKVARQRRSARAAQAANASRRAFNACRWDDVAFRRAPGRHFCSARCEAAFRDHEQRVVMTARPTTDIPDRRPLDVLALSYVWPQGRAHKGDLSRIDQKRGLQNRSPVDMGPRAFAVEMRTYDEANFRPPRRLKWIGTNLAVPESP